ncbi:acetylcholinesterase-like [Limulus polyphemus]|uniref:Carboxylic ester hydrolase n=1 Tax=Limulus polyphemus TaxID=6850 RepID=A0ABM1TS79_LIMPO|nr:acetylcholinesterase-like [Limulus polyphemus]XP_022258735.1 acetylcholinesterase-like [Limulus polyphemus]XP_022258736.1 acetylcholinesterase-like [Limulus polyphemus]XP_022258737.1 acetylcholinesterase-like [Limulus polyphemus]
MIGTTSIILYFILHLELITAVNLETDGSESPVINTESGLVRGLTTYTANGKTVDVFWGIPYAESPTGHLRFQRPQRKEPWEGVLNATTKPNSCFQTIQSSFANFSGATIWITKTSQSEDCLYLNIWVPHPQPQNATVMVWIHGGGFYSGSSTLDIYDGGILSSEENVIVVSMNYRVASLGFLYFNRSDAPGNVGLFDQLMALEWINKNIVYFGGDSGKVTIFGESAGASSVSLHLLSPLSKGLFNNAIMESGSILNSWSFHDRETAINQGLLLAEAVNCSHDPRDLDSTMECLRNADPLHLVKVDWIGFNFSDFLFTPVIDGIFLLDIPETLLNENTTKRQNLLVGNNQNEGSYFLVYYFPEILKEEQVGVTRKQFHKLVEKVIPDANNFQRKAIIHQYTDWLEEDNTYNNRDMLIGMMGDKFITCDTNEFAYKYAERGNDVFMYFFTHTPSVSSWPRWIGATHGDEISFVFGAPLNPLLDYSTGEQELARRIMKHWTNFARTGNPSIVFEDLNKTIHWPKYTTRGRHYLTLDTHAITVGKGPRAQQCAFWKLFYPSLFETTCV